MAAALSRAELAEAAVGQREDVVLRALASFKQAGACLDQRIPFFASSGDTTQNVFCTSYIAGHAEIY